ncbi:MAG: UDP-galactopyranose mutase [Polyangiaceae bacterium]
MGRTLYETYVENYNKKQWKIHPRDMDAEWARFRTLTLREKPDMFRGRWQGHPGDYNPMWSGMTQDVSVVTGLAEVSEDFQRVTVDGDPVDADLVVSTLPLSRQLGFINTFIVYVVVESEGYVMPSYATSFPNHYDFVRVMEFKQQYHVDSRFSVLDFEFPWVGECDEAKYLAGGGLVLQERARSRISRSGSQRIYPVSTRDVGSRPVPTRARREVQGVPSGARESAYCSMNTCIRMAMTAGENLDALVSGDPGRPRRAEPDAGEALLSGGEVPCECSSRRGWLLLGATSSTLS